MAVKRDRPYSQFNFLVNLGTTDANGVDAGFQECSGMGVETTLTEYRNGNEKENSTRKIIGMHKTSDVTLKRGVIGTLTLYNWLDEIRQGKQDAAKAVTIKLQSEDHKDAVTWKLQNALITKYTCGPLNAKGSDIAMEELTLSYERLEMS